MPHSRKAKSTKDATITPTVQRKRKIKPDQDTDATKKVVKNDPDVPSTSSDKEVEGEIKKMKFTGTIPVDEYFTLSDYHVYIDKDEVGPFAAYNAMLNQTNIGQNNNKYYIMQVLEHNSRHEYATWFRWGRVGKVAGKDCVMHGGSLSAAKQDFQKKFEAKTWNNWRYLGGLHSRPFKKVKGKYDLLEMDYGEAEEKEEKKIARAENESIKEEVPSRLDPRVLNVIDLIFNIQEFEACVKEMEFDVKKAPLGKLTTKQIKAGYETLKIIEKCIQENELGGPELADACSQFYTRIPHDFGMKRPPLITTPQQLKKKIELLEALADIQIAIEMMEADDKDGEEVNIRDQHYEYLGCKLEPLDATSKEFKMVKQYVAKSHGPPHQYDVIVENVFGVERKGDSERFKEHVGNKMLLWHGSRLTNWCGILKQGLRIAPPEAPASGYMFGKGVYFADVVSKSAAFCHTNQRQPHGFLLLCEVALGKTNDKIYADISADQLPKGKCSTKGMGRKFPDPKGNKKLDSGTILPLGKIISMKDMVNPYLMHNEFIVYDVAQIKAKYLVQWKYKSMWQNL